MINRLFEEENWNYYLLVVPIMVFVVGFFGWAYQAQIDEVVRGEGKVIPTGQTKVLQHLEGGIVAKILVNEGDTVEKDQVIYVLSNSVFNADLKEKELKLLALRAKAARLEATINGTKPSFSTEMRVQIPEIVENEMQIFNSDQQNDGGKINITKDQLKQKELKLNELQVKLENLQLELDLQTKNMAITETMLKKKVVSQKKYLDEMSKKQSLVTQLAETKNTIPIIQEEIEESRKKVTGTKDEIRSSNLKKLSEVKLEINSIREQNRANYDRDLRKEVVSPVKGVVNKLYFYTLGGIVKSGDKIAEITPIEDKLTIEANIKTSDRALIWAGQKVSIEITAYDYSRYGLLSGKVVSISPDSFTDKNGLNSYYLVKIAANENQFSKDEPILPGMVANVNILTGKKTILEYILKPLKDIAKNSLREQ